MTNMASWFYRRVLTGISSDDGVLWYSENYNKGIRGKATYAVVGKKTLLSRYKDVDLREYAANPILVAAKNMARSSPP